MDLNNSFFDPIYIGEEEAEEPERPDFEARYASLMEAISARSEAAAAASQRQYDQIEKSEKIEKVGGLLGMAITPIASQFASKKADRAERKMRQDLLPLRETYGITHGSDKMESTMRSNENVGIQPIAVTAAKQGVAQRSAIMAKVSAAGGDEARASVEMASSVMKSMATAKEADSRISSERARSGMASRGALQATRAARADRDLSVMQVAEEMAIDAYNDGWNDVMQVANGVSQVASAVLAIYSMGTMGGAAAPVPVA